MQQVAVLEMMRQAEVRKHRHTAHRKQDIARLNITEKEDGSSKELLRVTKAGIKGENFKK
jgi:hypothetical protein